MGMINLYYARCSGFFKAVSSSFIDKKDTIGEIRETIVLVYQEERKRWEWRWEEERDNENLGRIPVAAVLINETV